jgi:hypothetical protein
MHIHCARSFVVAVALTIMWGMLAGLMYSTGSGTSTVISTGLAIAAATAWRCWYDRQAEARRREDSTDRWVEDVLRSVQSQ